MSESIRITITRNRPYRLSVTIKEPGGLTAIPMDPDNDIVTMHFKEKKYNGKLILSKQLVAKEIDCPDPEEGEDPLVPPCYETGAWVLKLSAEETALFEAKEGFNEDGRPYLSGVRAQVSVDFTEHELEYADMLIEDIYVSDIGIEL